MPQRFLMAAPTIRVFGRYTYYPISLKESVLWLTREKFITLLRSHIQCEVLSNLTGQTIHPSEKGTKFPGLEPGDEVLVFYIPTSDAYLQLQSMPAKYMLEHYELGLLQRIDGTVEETAKER